MLQHNRSVRNRVCGKCAAEYRVACRALVLGRTPLDFMHTHVACVHREEIGTLSFQ